MDLFNMMHDVMQLLSVLFIDRHITAVYFILPPSLCYIIYFSCYIRLHFNFTLVPQKSATNKNNAHCSDLNIICKNDLVKFQVIEGTHM